MRGLIAGSRRWRGFGLISSLDRDNVLLARWDDDPWVRGAYTARSASSPMDTSALQAPVGRLHFAGEHTAGAWHGLMEGALRSGIRAANELLGRPARP